MCTSVRQAAMQEDRAHRLQVSMEIKAGRTTETAEPAAGRRMAPLLLPSLCVVEGAVALFVSVVADEAPDSLRMMSAATSARAYVGAQARLDSVAHDVPSKTVITHRVQRAGPGRQRHRRRAGFGDRGPGAGDRRRRQGPAAAWSRCPWASTRCRRCCAAMRP